MKQSKLLCHGAAWLAAFGMCLPATNAVGNEVTTATSAVAPPATRTGIHDVALTQGGLLVGQIVDDKMKPMADKEVVVQVDGRTTATTTTDANGVFAVTGLRGGVHQVIVDNSTENARLWAPGTAPPQAASHMRFVPGRGDVVRGQWGPPPAYNSMAAFATNPWVIAGVVATAIAVPIVLHNLDDDDDNGS
jgi:hypothetical protein